jgi:hypothetical protein
MSDEEVAFGITHNDHMGTEIWRRDAVHRIETGQIPNMLPVDLTPQKTRVSRWLVATVWFLVVVDVLAFVVVAVGA